MTKDEVKKLNDELKKYNLISEIFNTKKTHKIKCDLYKLSIKRLEQIVRAKKYD